MANKDQIVAKMQDLQRQIEQTVTAMPEAAWSKGVYEGGWNPRQLLAHMASTSGTAGFILGMARMPSAPSLPAAMMRTASTPSRSRRARARAFPTPSARSEATFSAELMRYETHRTIY